MNNSEPDFQALDLELAEIVSRVEAIAARTRGNCLALLHLLRVLEKLHREISENSFAASLPDNRQDLYALLRDIEEMGGWPYIERMRLRDLLEKLTEVS